MPGAIEQSVLPPFLPSFRLRKLKRAFKKLGNYSLFSLSEEILFLLTKVFVTRSHSGETTRLDLCLRSIPNKNTAGVGLGGSGGGRMQRMVVAILLVSSSSAEVYPVAPELVANVSLLLAKFYEVDCIQIFRKESLSLSTLEGIHKTWKKMATVESKVTTGVYTYDSYLRRKIERPRKVSCYTSLKIISDDEESRRGYAKFSMKFSLRDAVWLLYADSLASAEFFRDARVVFDDLIVLAETKSEDLILFHEVYRVKPDLPLKIMSLGQWTRAEGLYITPRLMYDRRRDLEGQVLRTASVENWPASYYKGGEWQGFLVKVWKEIQALINCTSVDVQGDNVIGMKLENGSWNGLVGMATRSEIDVIVSEIVIDKERSRALDFFHPIMKSSFQIYTRHLGYGWQWSSILKPFHASVWAAAVAWVLAGTLSWAAMHRLCVRHGLGSALDLERLSPFNSFFFVMQAMSQQGSHCSPNSHACRLFFFVSYAVSSVLIPSYSASLVSSLGQRVYLRSFDSLQDMVADGKYRLLVKENTAQHSFFVHSKQEFFKVAYEKLVEPAPERLKKLGTMDAMRVLCHLDNYAVMGLEDIVESRLRHLVTLDCPVVHMTHPVSTVYLTMAASKNHPYWGLINYQLGKLINKGIVDRLRKREFPLGHGEHFFKQTVVEVGMRQVVSAFVFMACFAAVSVLLLVLEVQWAYCKSFNSGQKRKRRSLRFSEPEKRLLFQMKMKRYARAQTQATQLRGIFHAY